MEENKSFSLVNIAEGKLLSTIYKDLAKPSVKKVGLALETVFDLSNTVLLPLKLVNEKAKLIFQKSLSKYEENLNKIEEDKIITVANEIGIPIIDRLTYISNEDISNAFINLLTKASSTDTVNLAHPGFISIIDRLAPDEAKIINYIHDQPFIPFITYNIHEKGQDAFHIPDYCESLTALEQACDLMFPQNIKIYLDNLVSLGILRLETFYFKTDETVYSKLQDIYKPVLDKLIEEHPIEKYDAPELAKGFYEITNFGRLFIDACTEPNE